MEHPLGNKHVSRVTIKLPAEVAEAFKQKSAVMGHDLTTVTGEILTAWLRVYNQKVIALGEIASTIVVPKIESP